MLTPNIFIKMDKYAPLLKNLLNLINEETGENYNIIISKNPKHDKDDYIIQDFGDKEIEVYGMCDVLYELTGFYKNTAALLDKINELKMDVKISTNDRNIYREGYNMIQILGYYKCTHT